MKAMILAAGFGTRFRPVTYTLPKPLVPLCNRPLIGWAVESLLAAGIRDLIVNVHHLAEAIEGHLRAHYFARAEIAFSFEKEILGTGGGVRRVRPLLEHETEFLLVNGDTVQFPPYDELIEARRDSDSLAALTLRHPPANDKFTAVPLDDGFITGFGKGTGEPLMFSGSHVISSRVFRYLPDKDFSGIVDEVYQPLLDAKRETIAGVIDDGLWFDIGTPQRYLTASRALLEHIVRGAVQAPEDSSVRGDSLVDHSASIDGSLVRSTVGARSSVQGELHDTSVWDDCAIGSRVRLERCIVAHGVELSGELALTDTLVCRDRDGMAMIRI
ncbi:MAG TPA: sugar phosphate nucleotidyltransferase [Thermoanaerobaculia bacterium]|nr:sugar phosphate nucleotidyltransferase [Thermoanaerobaculia bacterium]